MEKIPPECWLAKIDPVEFSKTNPDLADVINGFLAEMQPSDELWQYRIDWATGLAIRRGDLAVKSEVYMHADSEPPGLLIRWAGNVPTPIQIMTLRDAVSRLRDMPVGELKALLIKVGRVQVEMVLPDEALRIEQKCVRVGLTVERIQ